MILLKGCLHVPALTSVPPPTTTPSVPPPLVEHAPRTDYSGVSAHLPPSENHAELYLTSARTTPRLTGCPSSLWPGTRSQAIQAPALPYLILHYTTLHCTTRPSLWTHWVARQPRLHARARAPDGHRKCKCEAARTLAVLFSISYGLQRRILKRSSALLSCLVSA